MLCNRTYMAAKEKVERKWYVVDAADKPLGRVASQVAKVLMGKNKPTYTPHVLSGDFVVVVNAEKVRVTGNKMEQMEYDRYSYHPSGRKVDPIKKVLAEHPERVIWWAVRRMLPKTALGRGMLSRLKIYAGPEHPHQAQQPKPLELKTPGRSKA